MINQTTEKLVSMEVEVKESFTIMVGRDTKIHEAVAEAMKGIAQKIEIGLSDSIQCKIASNGLVAHASPSLHVSKPEQSNMEASAAESIHTQTNEGTEMTPDMLEVIEKIKMRAYMGRPMAKSSIRMSDNDLYQKAIELFDSWEEAVAIVSKDSNLPSYLFLTQNGAKYSRANILRELKRRKKEGFSIKMYDIQSENRPLYAAIMTIFGSSSNLKKALKEKEEKKLKNLI